jgi:hypothetical protein
MTGWKRTSDFCDSTICRRHRADANWSEHVKYVSFLASNSLAMAKLYTRSRASTDFFNMPRFITLETGCI